MPSLDPGLAGYLEALEGAAYSVHTNGGHLRVKGADQASFIQRQTTNDVRLLSRERGVLTVLTTPTARQLDVLYLFLEGESADENQPPAIELLTLPGRGSATYNFLKSPIFFMGKVTISDRQGCLEEANQYAKEREAFGKPIG